MKKWVFPICLLIVETIFIVLMYSSIFATLPSFIQSFLGWIESCFTFLSKTFGLPSSVLNGESNYVFSNFIILFILDGILIGINFLIFVIKKRNTKNKDVEEDKIIEGPKSEFDPILFEKKTPTLRLAFIWVPINYWIIYYIVINSPDLQNSMRNGNKIIYSLFNFGISFYNDYVITLVNKNFFIDMIVFLTGLLFVVFIYWIIFSILSIAFRKPFSKFKAKRALKDHERRVSACKKEEIVIENMDIIEHAKFKHEKSIVETIADIDKSKDPSIVDKSYYFSDVVHGITDLGIIDGEVKQIEKPRIERKPIQLVFTKDYLEQKENKSVYDVSKNPTPEVSIDDCDNKDKIDIDPKFDPLKKIDEVDLTETEDKRKKLVNSSKKVKPLTPVNLREPVSVTPVKPITVLLKNQKSSEPIIEIRRKRNDRDME